MNLEKERELFESWCTTNDNYCIHRYKGDDKYSEWDTQAAWEAWLASASREGYKLVPVEPTEEMYLSGHDCKVENGSTIDIYKTMIGACDE